MLKSFNYNDVSCGHGIVKAFGNNMDIYLYIVDGLLVDTGPSRLKSSIDFFKAKEINQVALTHVHEDHSGMAWWLQANKQAPIYLSNVSLNEANQKAKIPLYRTITWGKRLPFTPKTYKDTLETENYSFQVIAAPGHTTDHIVLYEKNKGWLFTGDLFLNTKQLVCIREENIPQTIKSLQMLSKLDFDTIYCGHSGVHHEKAKEKLIKRLDFFLSLQEKTEKLYNEGLTAKEIDKKLFPKKLPIYYVSTGEWSSYNMINSLINDK